MSETRPPYGPRGADEPRTNADGSVTVETPYGTWTLTGNAEAAARCIVDLVRGEAREAKRKETWGKIGPEAMERLCARFPSLRHADGARPWHAKRFLRWLCSSGAVTGGSRHAAKFVLQVWNSGTDWGEVALDLGVRFAKDATLEPFNVAQALGTWDDQHRRAFLAWCENPFFP